MAQSGSDGQYIDSRTEPQWAAVYRSLDVISPWSVGRFGDDQGADSFARLRLARDAAETSRLGVEYMPVVFPVFSWAHGAGRNRIAPINVTPRRCGAFYQRHIYNAIQPGAQMLYTAMFDEIDEGTAILKLAADPSNQSVGTDLLPLNANDCPHATSDLYLRLAGQASELKAR